MKLILIALAVMTTLGLAQASEIPDGPHIITSGSARIEAVPDIAELTIEVNIIAKEATTAKKQVDDRVAQYLAFLEKSGITRKDIRSANLRTQPEYSYQNGKSIFKGYRASRVVEVTLRQLDKLNSLLDGALKSGLNEISSVRLDVAQPEIYKDKARQAAIDDALHKAQALASGFHSNLGTVYRIQYQASAVPKPRMMRASGAISDEAVSAQQTYQQETIPFNDQVDVVFELQPAPVSQ
ncbi:oxidative stress defense protein [Enterobacteriaceae bacterium ESL0689]|nr:oxidative stress defense protein [Enterobacteriaceae bacterium ESL0689]